MNTKEIKKGRHSQEPLLRISLLYAVSKMGKIPYLIKDKKAGDPRQKHSGMTPLFNNGFTLIELLVVVLIIGILAAIALPQYKKAVEKSRAAQGITMLKSAYQAAEVYYLANGTWPESFADLDIQVPWTGNTKWNTSTQARDAHSGEEWSVQLIGTETTKGVEIGRISGPYAGTGFGIYSEHAYDQIPKKQLLCLEKNDMGNFLWEDKGAYCEKIFAGTKVFGTDPSWTWIYSLP